VQRFLERLAWPDPLPEGEQDRLIKSVSEILAFNAGDEIVPAEAPVDFSSIILEWLLLQAEGAEDWKPADTAFHVPGDFCDLHA